MKMAKKVREYKAGDFIFAKVKGYPAWPARVQRQNGKKYFVYFYGTAETANLPPNMIFDYAENKDKFLTKTVKRRDFNDGVKQIEYDFANNVPLEQVIGLSVKEDGQDESENQEDDSVIDTTADETIADESMANTTQNDTIVEDSDDAGLVIDEVKAKGRKSTAKAKETPRKEPKTPKAKKNEKEEEVTSRSGRKIRPKRYIDEHTEDNLTIPSGKKRPTSPTLEKEVRIDKYSKDYFHITPQSDLEDLKEPFTNDDSDKENILIAYLPTGQYVGIRLFQSRPHNFKNEGARLKWDKQQAINAITMKIQLESGQITPQSVASQLLMDMSLTDEEKDKLDKEREIDERKSRLQFLKTEVKMLELDAKIKTCLCLEKADTETCLKLLDELMELDIKPLMLLKHPSCLETVKRMRAYVGNTSSWGFSEAAAIAFGQDAHRIRKQADAIYTSMKKLFTPSDAISFFEYFTERVAIFKKITDKMPQEDIMEMVLEPIEMSQPKYSMKFAASANDTEASFDGNKSKSTGKAKKITNTPSKPPAKRQNTKKQEKPVEDTEKEKEEKKKEPERAVNKEAITETIETRDTEVTQMDTDKDEQTNETNENNDKDKEIIDKDNDKDKINEKDDATNKSVNKDNEPKDKNNEPKDKVNEPKDKINESKDKINELINKINEPKDKINEPKDKINEPKDKNNETKDKDNESKDKINETDKEKSEKRKLSTESKSSNNDEIKESDNSDEPKAKRTRETKKTEPVPRSPAKRKSKV